MGVSGLCDRADGRILDETPQYKGWLDRHSNRRTEGRSGGRMPCGRVALGQGSQYDHADRQESVAEEEGDYGRAYNLYQMSYVAGSSESLYRLACLCYDGKFQPGEQDGKKEAAGWLEYADRIRPSKINQNSYIYIASQENFPKTKLALQCVKKLEENDEFRTKYGNCTLDEMVEKAVANGDIDNGNT